MRIQQETLSPHSHQWADLLDRKITNATEILNDITVKT